MKKVIILYSIFFINFCFSQEKIDKPKIIYKNEKKVNLNVKKKTVKNITDIPIIKEKSFEEKTAIYDRVNSFHNGFATVFKNKLCGLINSNGDEIVKPEYDLISSWGDNRILVFKNHKCGYLDYKGNKITDIIYSSGSGFLNGFAIVTLNFGKDNYFIDINGNIRFSKFDKASVFMDDIAPVKLNNKTYFINKNGICVSDFDNFDIDHCYNTVTKDYTTYRISLKNVYYFVHKNDNGKAYLTRDTVYNDTYCKKL